MSRNKRTLEDQRKSNLDLMLTLFNQGVNIGDSEVAKLLAAGLIQAKTGDEKVVELADGSEIKIDLNKYQTDDTRKKQKLSGEYREITEADWRPVARVNHTKEFVAWIDSINRPDGFFNSIYYEKFELYCRQSEQWFAEMLPEMGSDDEIFEYKLNENARCKENSLYACDKYGELKEANASGMHKYKAAKVHKVLLYLLDCGYSINLVKPRQIAATSTIAMWVLIKIMFSFNLSVKFISENKVKAQDTLENKIKYGYSQYPDWLRPEGRNDALHRFVFGEMGGKGEREGNNSGVEVLPPTKTAIASGTPDVTIIDETGNIELLNSIIMDNLPTMYGLNPETQLQELLRQVVLLGTGGEMEKAGIVLKTVFMQHWALWEKREFTIGIIPIYFNVWWKMGMTRKFYEELKAMVYSAEGPTAEEDKIKFHQQNPITLEDVFLQGGKTLVGMGEIQRNLDRISDMNLPCDYGFFEPIYDTGAPAHEGSDVPFKIIGANFIPCSLGDERVTTTIFQHPKNWINRYYQGTDPIASDNGHSKMSSTIWDSYYNTASACVNFRTDDYSQCFLQCLLLGIYYDVDKKTGKTPEVIESNIGLAYRVYIENKGLENGMVLSTELPTNFQTKGGSVKVGIDNKGLRNQGIIDTLRDVFTTYGNQIMISVYFNQLKTFVCKPKGGGQTWEPLDKRYNWDDALFGLVYSYLCSQCYSNRKPINMDGEDSPTRKGRLEYKFVHVDGQLRRVTKREYLRMKGKGGTVLPR